jgi:hypothetical protein
MLKMIQKVYESRGVAPAATAHRAMLDSSAQDLTSKQALDRFEL